MKVVRFLCLSLGSYICMAEIGSGVTEDIPEHMKSVFQTLTPENIVESFFVLEIENSIELSYKEGASGDLIGETDD